MAHGPFSRLMAVAAAMLAVTGASARDSRGDDAPAAATTPQAPPQRHAPADARAVELVERFASAWKNEQAEALRALLAPGEIRFRLDPPGTDDPASGGDAPALSAAQVFYMLQNHFVAVHTLDARLERRIASSGPDLAHGVMLTEWAVDASAPTTERRLFIGLRRLDDGWRVVEVRALP